MSALAGALRVPVDDVVAWESGERFPTRRAVEAMQRLDDEGRDPAPHTGQPSQKPPAPTWSDWANPELWCLLRKLAAWPDLRRHVLELAASYPDPADPER